MKTLIVSSSLDPDSRSEELAQRAHARLLRSGESTFISLKSFSLSGRDLHQPQASSVYRNLHTRVAQADGLVLASPVYNWSCCAELKRFVEIVGTTPPDGSVKGAFFDKVVAFINAAGAPQSYMSFSSLATSMMLDFKCVISPYHVYVTNRDWNGSILSDRAVARLEKSMDVFLELSTLLKARSYRSEWEI